CCLLVYCACARCALHSFPTRRSCDLGISKLPYILYPYIDINTSVVNESVAVALTIVFILGLLMLIPSLYLLLRLFIFDKDYVDGDRKSTRLNSSHVSISYAVSCLKSE